MATLPLRRNPPSPPTAHRPDRRALMLARSLRGKDSPAAMGFGYRF